MTAVTSYTCSRRCSGTSAPITGMIAATAMRRRSRTTTIPTSRTSGNVNSQPRLSASSASCTPSHAIASSTPRRTTGSSRRTASATASNAVVMNSAALAFR